MSDALVTTSFSELCSLQQIQRVRADFSRTLKIDLPQSLFHVPCGKKKKGGGARGWGGPEFHWEYRTEEDVTSSNITLVKCKAGLLTDTRIPYPSKTQDIKQRLEMKVR